MSSREEEARRAQEDADWQAFIDSYGDRPEFPEQTEVVPLAEYVLEELPPELAFEDEDRYVPPPPPPAPRPHGLRAFAWFGLFGVPTFVLLCVMVKVSLPSLLILLLVAWFVGGFGYLVATMSGPKDPDAGWDDGAVL